MINTSKVIHAPVGGGRYTVTAPIVKEDYGLYLLIEDLELPSTYEVDFSNSEHNGTSVTMIGNSDGVLIPSQFISSGKDVFAFLYHVGADFGRTVYKFRIPNKLRPDRTDEEPTPAQASTIDQAIVALNSAVAKTAQDVETTAHYEETTGINADLAERSAENAQTYASQAEQSAQNAYTYALSANGASGTALQSAELAQTFANNAEQIKSDVESMVDDAQGYANASAQSASQASASEQGCARAVLDAASAAAIARARADEANGYAQTASSKASEASGYAGTASTKASESALSASRALTYKTDAESAKTASQTAQGLAESARDDAIDAKTDAESARDEAQNLVDGISGKVEQIDQNTADIASLEEDRYKPYAVDSASGAIASFVDGADGIPLKSLAVSIEPKQDGTGDPAPDNVRPISGWTEVDVEQSGKNLLDVDKYGHDLPRTQNGITWSKVRDGVYHVEGTATAASYFNVSFKGELSTAMPCSALRGKNLYLSTTNDNIICYTGYFKIDGTFEALVNGSVLPDEAVALRFYLRIAPDTTINTDFSVQLEIGSTATDYEPYTGRSITIDLGQTVYGGKLDVLSGVLTVDRAMVDMGSLSWSYQSGFGRMKANIPDIEYATSNNLPSGNLMCSIYVDGPAALAYHVPKSVCVGINSTVGVLVYDDTYTDATSFTMAVTGQTLCYKLATPIEIQLDAHTINSLYGANNIWADTGDTACEYRADPDLYIQRKMPDVPVDDVQINGQSIVTDGVANIVPASTSDIKSGSSVSKFVPTGRQETSVFYGLAKAASDTTQSQSSNAVGNYTEDAKIAIQKMLGIYEAPWELINEETFTNATEADLVISTDANGEGFELTDAFIIFLTPRQDTVAKVGNYGQTIFNLSNNDFVFAESGGWENAANAAGKGFAAQAKVDGSLITSMSTQAQSASSPSAWRSRWNITNGFRFYNNVSITSVTIRAITGTAKYTLYGRRKWQ